VFFFVSWEIVPTLMVVGYFRNIPATSDSMCVGRWSCLSEGSTLRRWLEGWPFKFPPEYFEETDENGGVISPSGTGGGLSATRSADDGMPDLVGGGFDRVSALPQNAPAYVAMRDTDTSGSHSSLLPPGSFVRSTPLSHSHQYAANAGLMGRSHMGAGLHPGVPVQPGHADLYGSPTWLNAQHPALVHLSPGIAPSHAGTATAAAQLQQHLYQQQQQQQHSLPHGLSSSQYAQLHHYTSSTSVNAPNIQHGVGVYSAGGMSTGPYEDEHDTEQYGAHPYTQQQQAAAAAHAALIQQQNHATGASQPSPQLLPQQAYYTGSARPQLHEKRSSQSRM
jgi:hypothetical protein